MEFLSKLTPNENLLDDFRDSMKFVWKDRMKIKHDYLKKSENKTKEIE